MKNFYEKPFKAAIYMYIKYKMSCRDENGTCTPVTLNTCSLGESLGTYLKCTFSCDMRYNIKCSFSCDMKHIVRCTFTCDMRYTVYEPIYM